MLTPWWKAFPGRLETELEALRLAGIDVEPNDPEIDGFLEVHLTVPVGDKRTRLRARFPDTYPYLRPEVYADDLNLDHHQNPFQKNLCLLGRRLDHWLPQMSLAQLVEEQLPKVLRATTEGMPAGQLAEVEEQQAEPVSVYYSYTPHCSCILDPSSVPPDASCGSALIAIQEEASALRGAVIELKDPAGNNVGNLRWREQYRSRRVAQARWVVLDEAIVQVDHDQFDEQLCERCPELRKNQWSGDLDLILVGFPEETGWRTMGRGWVLLLRRRVTSKGSFKPPQRFLIRVEQAGADSYYSRAPEARAIANTRVAIFGVGCVGAPIAIELARAGVQELTLIDGDDAEFGASVRWPLGLSAVGYPKVQALKAFINANYPETRVTAHVHRVGAIPGVGPTRDRDVLPQVLDTVDLVVDATAEFAVQRLLGDLALRRGLTFVSAHGTHGGFGGEVLRIRKGLTGCWMCLAHYRADGTIPLPPSKEGAWQQPPGCASPTFEGASWDLSEVSLAAVRAVVDSVSSEPRAGWDVGVLSLRGRAGERIPPSWETFRLKPHAKCTSCAARD